MNQLKKIVSIMLAAASIMSMPAQAMARNETDTIQKEEVVYVSLQGDGSFGNAYVVNAFTLAKPGQIVDYGNYDSVQNLSSADVPALQDGMVKVNAPAGRFYYQGDISAAKLPWLISVSYLLDGKPMLSKELAGAKGHLAIRIAVRDNPAADEKTFAKNYTLQISLTLDTGLCSNIAAEGATLANAGKNKVVNFVKMPNSDGDYSIETDVLDFAMDGIQISGVPLSMKLTTPDTGEITDGLTDLQDGISDLDSGAQELNDGVQSLNDGTQQLYTGIADMQAGMNTLKTGFADLVGGNGALASGSQQILDALTAIQTKLGSFSFQTDKLSELALGSASILQGLQGVSGGLAALQGSFSQTDAAVSGMTGGTYASLQDANAGTIAALNTQIAALSAADPVANAAQIALLSQTVGVLTADSGLVAGLKTGIDGDGSAENPGLAAGTAALSAQYAQFDAGVQELPGMMSSIAGGMTDLKAGIDQLTTNYSSFHGGLVNYTNGAASLYGGYAQMCDGFAQLAGGSGDLAAGTNSLAEGTEELVDGTGELRDETQNMDGDMQNEIDKMMETYTGSDFVPVSFVSPMNTEVSSVQFVMMTEEIKQEEKAKTEEQAVESSFWDRLLALFGM